MTKNAFVYCREGGDWWNSSRSCRKMVCTTTAVGLLESVDLAVSQSAASVSMMVLSHCEWNAAVRRDDEMEFLGANFIGTYRCTDQTVYYEVGRLSHSSLFVFEVNATMDLVVVVCVECAVFYRDDCRRRRQTEQRKSCFENTSLHSKIAVVVIPFFQTNVGS